jgi:hypothetical protein
VVRGLRGDARTLPRGADVGLRMPGKVPSYRRAPRHRARVPTRVDGRLRPTHGRGAVRLRSGLRAHRGRIQRLGGTREGSVLRGPLTGSRVWHVLQGTGRNAGVGRVRRRFALRPREAIRPRSLWRLRARAIQILHTAGSRDHGGPGNRHRNQHLGRVRTGHALPGETDPRVGPGSGGADPHDRDGLPRPGRVRARAPGRHRAGRASRVVGADSLRGETAGASGPHRQGDGLGE